MPRPGGRPPKDLLAEIEHLLQHEFYSRLKDPQKAAKMQDYVLIQGIRAIGQLRQYEEDNQPQLKAQTVNILQIVEQPGLPQERRVELLQKAIRQAKAEGKEIAPYVRALETVAGKQTTDQLLELEDTSGPDQ